MGAADSSRGLANQNKVEGSDSIVIVARSQIGIGVAGKEENKVQRRPMNCYACRVSHQLNECPKWNAFISMVEMKPS